MTLRTLLSELRERLPFATSSQLDILREIEQLAAARRADIAERCSPSSRAARSSRAAAAAAPLQHVAGTGAAGHRDGDARAEARFDLPIGLALDGEGVVFVADAGNHRVRRVAADGAVATVAGGDEGEADADAGEGARLRPHRRVLCSLGLPIYPT